MSFSKGGRTRIGVKMMTKITWSSRSRNNISSSLENNPNHAGMLSGDDEEAELFVGLKNG